MNTFFERAAAAFMASTMLFTSVGANNGGSFFNTIATGGSGSTVTDTGYYQPAKFSDFGKNDERDTKGTGDDKEYNTSLGLHTDKTVEKVYPDDGRTFDLGLETWYVGENPADVGMVIDGSGSMAWTTNAIAPIALTSVEGSNNVHVVNALDAAYKDNKITTNPGTDPKKAVEEFKKVFDDGNGFLKEEGVNYILNNTQTDNTRLEYDGYRYYVYENRSSVDEFAPIGYWNGEFNAPEPIAQYKFNGNLKNEYGGTAKIINNVDNGDTFDTEVNLTETKKVTYDSTHGIKLNETDKKGNVVIDLSKINYDNFEIDFNIWAIDATETTVETPILYLGNASKTSTYFYVKRGKGDNSDQHMRLNVGNKDYTIRNVFKDKFNKNTLSFKLTVKKNEDGKIDVGLASGSDTALSNGDNNPPPAMTSFNKEDGLYLILGGGELLADSDAYSENYINSLKITTYDGDGTGKIVGNYSLKSDLTNSATVDGKLDDAKFCENGAGGVFNVTDTPAETALDAEYSRNMLNLTKTAKNCGGVLLNAKLKDPNNFTIAFKTQLPTNNIINKYEAELVYMGSKDTQKEYYDVFRSQSTTSPQSGNKNHIRIAQNSDYGDANTNSFKRASGSNVFSNTEVKNVVITVKYQELTNNNIVSVYVNGKSDDTSGGFTATLSKLDSSDFNIILGGLKDKYDGNDILIDDLCIYDKVIEDEEELQYISNQDSKLTKYAYYSDGKTGNPIGVFSGGVLSENPNIDERRGWYYVSSSSNWENINYYGTGKTFVGLKKESNLTSGKKIPDIATIPSSYKGNEIGNIIRQGDSVKEANYSDDDGIRLNPNDTSIINNARSILFYIDNQNCLRCFFNSGSNTKYNNTNTKDDEVNSTSYETYAGYFDSANNKYVDGTYKNSRTQCSLVYYKPNKSGLNDGVGEIKQETL